MRREWKRRKRINEEIKIEEWKEFFIGLLGAVEEKVVRGKKERGDEQGETELEWEELKRRNKSGGNGKAIGKDGIPNMEVRRRRSEKMGVGVM